MYSKLVVGLALAGAASAAELVRRDTGAGGHDHSHAHAAPAPAAGYSEPVASSGYSAPSSGYSQPSTGYASPSSYGGYDVGGYEEEGFDLSIFIIPALILLGLSLLFPTVTSVAVSGRRKRDVDDASNPLTDVVERVNDIYLAVVESEECMQRIACEIGGLAGDVGLKENAIAKMADPFVPAKYKAYYQQFKSGQNCHKIKCGSIF